MDVYRYIGIVYNLMNNIEHINEYMNKQKILHEKKSDFILDIKCPNTGKSLDSSLCFKCNFCKIYEGNHVSGRNLTSLICAYVQGEVEK